MFFASAAEFLPNAVFCRLLWALCSSVESGNAHSSFSFQVSLLENIWVFIVIQGKQPMARYVQRIVCGIKGWL